MGPIERAIHDARKARHARMVANAVKAEAPPIDVVDRAPVRVEPLPTQPDQPVYVPPNEMRRVENLPQFTGLLKTLHTIMAEVAAAYEMTPAVLKSRAQTQTVCRARNEYFYRAANETTLGFPTIARACGDRDHTTAMCGCVRHSSQRGIPSPRGLDGWASRRAAARGARRAARRAA